MAGIDSNTLLYLRGDSFVDLSPNNHAIENKGGITTIDSNNFGTALNLTVDSTRLHIETLNLPGDKFTIDWWEQTTATVSSNTSLVTNLTEDYPDTSVASFILGRSSGGQNSMWARDTSGTSGWTLQTFKIGDYRPSEWVHKALIYDGTTFYSYVNGILYSSGTCNGLNILDTGTDINAFRAGTASYKAHVESLRITHDVVWTADFEPPTKPYTTVSLNVINQNNNEVNFSVTKESVNESINKVDILKCFIELCKKNNIEIFAWVNPYRISNGTDISFLSKNNKAYQWLNTNKVKIIEDRGIYYNPAEDEVIDLI